MLELKSGRLHGNPPESIAALTVRYIDREPALSSRFMDFIGADSTLVPVPKSSLLTEGGLWVPQLFSAELVSAGFGGRSAPVLKRAQAIPKAAGSLNAERPTALLNFRTLVVQRDLETATRLVLVDDVVTAGATLLGCANKLNAAFPDTPIRAVTAARTISDGSRFRTTIDPTFGTIVLRENGKTRRDP